MIVCLQLCFDQVKDSMEVYRRHLSNWSNVLVTVNSAVNFVVYFAVSRQFRADLVNMLRYRTHNRSSTSNDRLVNCQLRRHPFRLASIRDRSLRPDHSQRRIGSKTCKQEDEKAENEGEIYERRGDLATVPASLPVRSLSDSLNRDNVDGNDAVAIDTDSDDASAATAVKHVTIHL